MWSKYLIILLVIAGATAAEVSTAQQVANAIFLDTPIDLDGAVDARFAERPGLTGFKQFAPDPLADARQRTEVWVGYDDVALYVVAKMYDTAPDSILNQLSERDRLRNTDWFAVSINPYRDGINATNFIVSPVGVQYDSKFSADGGGGNQVMQSGDQSWDGVWASACAKTSDGWVAELKIPYSALRFPDEPVQLWDINFARQTRRFREEAFWNPVDPKGPGPVPQMGRLTGIRDIKPPFRLQATPFITAATQLSSDPANDPRNNSSSSIGGGLDLKYGISDAFTLDMTAIPDFSNARSDDQVLNLTANEIRFDENRAFFTEGVELFNKGNFFYSRRVGGRPINFGNGFRDYGDDEILIENPRQTNLLNATKVSGRFQNGLGIGVFNAVEGPSYAVVRDTMTQGERQLKTAPVTNYSVVSFDQNLPNNSFVTLINTNVWRSGRTYDANLTGFVYDLRTKSNAWGISGKVGVSQKYGVANPDADGTDAQASRRNIFGHTYNLELARLTGRFRYGAEYYVEDDQYDPNDLGFLFFNNERSVSAFAEYNWFEPFGKFNSAEVGMSLEGNWLYQPGMYAGTGLNVDSRFTTRKFFTFGGGFFTDLSPRQELQDTRTPDRTLEFPAFAELRAFISSDYRKKWAIDARPRFGRFWSDGRSQARSLYISPRYRVNDALDLRIGGDFVHNKRFLGYVGHSLAGIERFELTKRGTAYTPLPFDVTGIDEVSDDGFVGSYRTFRTIEVEATAEYSFTANMNLSLRARHYWSRVRHDEYFEVGRDALPRSTTYTGLRADGTSAHDQSFNAFNIDLFYRWRFAPGSDIFLSYKTQSFFEGLQQEGFFGNLGVLPDNRIDNSLTLKVIYFLDAAVLGK